MVALSSDTELVDFDLDHSSFAVVFVFLGMAVAHVLNIFEKEIVKHLRAISVKEALCAIVVVDVADRSKANVFEWHWQVVQCGVGFNVGIGGGVRSNTELVDFDLDHSSFAVVFVFLGMAVAHVLNIFEKEVVKLLPTIARKEALGAVVVVDVADRSKANVFVWHWQVVQRYLGSEPGVCSKGFSGCTKQAQSQKGVHD